MQFFAFRIISFQIIIIIIIIFKVKKITGKNSLSFPHHTNGFERCILCISGRSELFYEKDFKHPFQMAGRFAVGPWDIHSYVFECKHAMCRNYQGTCIFQESMLQNYLCPLIKWFFLSFVFKIFIIHRKLLVHFENNTLTYVYHISH